MVKITREQITVFILFALVLAIRLFFAFQHNGFDYDSYYALRQAEHIRETGVPLFNDPLSYEGRTFITPPLFYYVLAGFSFFIPLELAAKIITSIGFASLVLIIYLITKHITKNKTAAFVSALFAGFVPVIYETLTQVSIYSISLPLIFLLSYVFIRLEDKRFISLSIILAVLLLLTHASFFLLLIAFFVYFVILRIEKETPSKKEVETGLFLFFLALWFNILLYKKAFFLHSIRLIWQNIPAPLLSAYFKDISFLGIVYAMGAVPLLLGVYAVYQTSFKAKSRPVMLYISFALVSFVMLWLKLVSFRTGLLFLSINLIILSSYSIKHILVSLEKTKITPTKWLVVGSIILVFLITTMIPFINASKPNIPPADDIKALQWISSNTEKDAVILGSVEEGFLINYIGQRKNVADLNFLFEKNIDQTYTDINSLFTLRLKSEAIRTINEYKINYILLSSRSMKKYGVSQLFYADSDCFEIVYDNDALIYKFLGCKIE